MDIVFDEPIEVTEQQFKKCLSELGGGIAHRIDDNGRRWIKLWAMWAKPRLKEIISQ